MAESEMLVLQGLHKTFNPGTVMRKMALAGVDLTLRKGDFITVIGGKELLYAARSVAARNYEPMYPYVGAAIVYLLLVMLFTWLLGIFERRLRASDRR